DEQSSMPLHDALLPELKLDEADIARRKGRLQFDAPNVRHSEEINATLDMNVRLQNLTADLQQANAALVREAQERKLAEAEVRKSEEKFAKVFQASPAGITVSRMSDGKIIETNDAYLRMLGYTREEV